MKSSFAICSFLFAITCLAASRHATGFEFIVFQWPGSYCSAKHGCCYPKTGKPDKDFTIGGFWPDDLLNSRPTYCNNKTIFRVSQIQDLRKRLDKNWPSLRCPSRNSKSLWRHEWLKYGTCSDYTQRQYFETALKIKENVGLLKILQNAGIEPNGNFYTYGAIYDAIQEAMIYMPSLMCNRDKFGNYQLSQIVMCGESDGHISDCPALLPSNCGSNTFRFPSF